MSTNKKPTPKKNAKKTAPTKAAPKKQAPKAKNGPSQKSSAPAKAPQLKPKAKDGDGDGFVQDGTDHERRKPGRPKKQAPVATTPSKPTFVVTPSVNVQSTGIDVASSSTTTTASGIIPPIMHKTVAPVRVLPQKKRGFFSRIFRRNKKSH
jgi:hypothetical protein